MKTNKTIYTILLTAVITLILALAGCPESDKGKPEVRTITSFIFKKEDTGLVSDLTGIINQTNKTITFTTQLWINNIDKLPAVFKLDKTGNVYVNNVLQESGVTQNDFRKDVVYKLSDDIKYTVIFESPQASGLPVITINTVNSAPILDRENWVTMTFSLSDPNNPLNDIPPVSNQQIRGRGNSSWTQEPVNGKRPYRIRFTNAQQQSPFGLPAARNWVLLKVGSEINTPFGFELGKRLELQYTCSYNPVQLYLNNNYRGTYLFTEHRQADPAVLGAPGRPKVDLNEGWFIEIDRYYDEEPKFRTNNYNLPVMIKSPEAGSSGYDPGYEFLRNDLNELADLMASDSFPENGYRDLIDIDTFVKYFIVQTVVMNNDLFRPRVETGEQIGSTFFYKDKNGKISAGPLWDLDWTFSPWAFEGRTFEPNKFPYQIHQWFSRFHQDPVFHARYKEIWNNNYQNNILTMSNFIDSHGAKLRKGALENQRRWRPSDMGWFDWHVGHIKEYFSTRAAFLHTEYNKVDVIPASKDYGNSTDPQTFTLVSFGEITNPSAKLNKGADSAFEISAPLSITPAGAASGEARAFLGTITVRPKTSITSGTHTDTLVLSGSNQGRTFTHHILLNK